MTPPRLERLWQAGFSVVVIAQKLTLAEGQEVSVGTVCRRLKQAGLIPVRQGRCPPYYRRWRTKP